MTILVVSTIIAIWLLGAMPLFVGASIEDDFNGGRIRWLRNAIKSLGWPVFLIAAARGWRIKDWWTDG